MKWIMSLGKIAYQKTRQLLQNQKQNSPNQKQQKPAHSQQNKPEIKNDKAAQAKAKKEAQAMKQELKDNGLAVKGEDTNQITPNPTGKPNSNNTSYRARSPHHHHSHQKGSHAKGEGMDL